MDFGPHLFSKIINPSCHFVNWTRSNSESPCSGRIEENCTPRTLEARHLLMNVFHLSQTIQTIYLFIFPNCIQTNIVEGNLSSWTLVKDFSADGALKYGKLDTPFNWHSQAKQTNSHLILQRKKNTRTKKHVGTANLQQSESPLPIPIEKKFRHKHVK